MAGNPVDPLAALSAALALPADSKEQNDLLTSLRETLEVHQGPITILCQTLIRTVPGSGDSLLKRWVLDLLQFGICRSNLAVEAKTQLALQSLDVLAGLLNEHNPNTVKIAIQCLTGAYPLVFRQMCLNRANPKPWEVITTCKARIFDMAWAQNVGIGVKICAVKFMQRVIVVQTRGIADPRLHNKNDPNLATIPNDHPFISSQQLDQEGVRLLTGILELLFKSSNAEILSAILNSWSALIKMRPLLVNLVVSALTTWTPAALAGQSSIAVRSIEKIVRVLLVHISRTPNGAPYAQQITDAVAAQSLRMERAASEERARKAAAAATAKDVTLKRPASSQINEASEPKRQKLDAGGSSASILAGFDFSTLPTTLVTELVVANLQAFTPQELSDMVLAYRQTMPVPAQPRPSSPSPRNLEAPSRKDKKKRSPAPQQPIPQPPVRSRPSEPVKEEPVDPLSMDVDEEELEYEPDRINYEMSGAEPEGDAKVASAAVEDVALELVDFKPPPPQDLSEDDRNILVEGALGRIRSGMEEDGLSAEVDRAHAGEGANFFTPILIRMITRVVYPHKEESADEDAERGDKGAVQLFSFDRQEKQRQALLNYIMTDFPARVDLATAWMNEEWYNDRIRGERDQDWAPNYDAWLGQIVASYQTLLENKDKTFPKFLLNLPHVPADAMSMLRELSADRERMQVGFNTLREFVLQRPTLRSEAMTILLDLTTHPEKVTRGAAIITVKRWVPDAEPMNSMIREFAHHMLRKLQGPPEQAKKEGGDGEDAAMEEGEMPPEALIQTPYLPDHIELPAQSDQVLQHLELMFALSTKVPQFLDEIFSAYGGMDTTVQEVLKRLITPLIKSLGPSHKQLLTLLRTCPPGAESLALRVLNILTEKERPSAQLVSLVKGLVHERDLDARFLIPIIAEMDKADIFRHLPRIVGMLNGQPEPKALVKSVFGAIVTTPPQTFGTVSSNAPRVRQSELLTPAELMVGLHDSEKEIGLKSAIEAIGICFSMTDVYRSEILAVVMQQIVDEPVLPVLFLRTVIQAVATYKSLVGFVSTTLLSRLITKKIWTNPPLWEGFIRCAKVIAPASFGALLQLPKEQLRELVDKQPSLKAGLRDFVMKKAGNKARVAGFLDIFGDGEDGQPHNTPQPTGSPMPAASETPPPEPQPHLDGASAPATSVSAA